MNNEFSLKRTAHLARWNAVLLTRNRLAFVYAVVMPLLPLALLFTGERGDEAVGANAVTTLFLVAGLFPVYYNVLAQFVNRRDELVLKRMRTGEVRDAELIVSIAIPGAVSALVSAAIAVPVALAFDQPLPVNPVVYAGGAVLIVIMFTAFAYWTAAWTQSAEAAQLTSLPIILIVSAAPLLTAIPDLSDTIRDLVSYTPGAAMSDLVRAAWFGFDGPLAEEPTLTFSSSWGPALQPLAVLFAWSAVAYSLASRSMRWEPRS